MRKPLLVAIPLALLAAGLLYSVGCQKKDEEKPAALAAPHSAIEVDSTATGITVRSPKAVFVLSPGGRLTAALRQDQSLSSLDSNQTGSGQILTVGKKEFTDAQF